LGLLLGGIFLLFSSVEFLYYFFPAVLLLYFAAGYAERRRGIALRNYVLLIASVIFYAWGEPMYLLLMLFQAISGWAFGLLIERFRGAKSSKISLIVCLVIGLGGLMFFKYADFFIQNINLLPRVSIPALRLALPIGISFYTFQILSYDIDLYRGNCGVQRNFFTFSTYVALFPQLIAGPIVRYVDVERELASRAHTLENFALGARRFVAGLAKKVLIANVLGELVATYKESGSASVLFTWLYIVAYALHIYFDFSGYSDMAIGMGRIFGFKFLENFNFPYISKSITDFWRRWHISLSSWFRDYVYIPLGGNRVSKSRHILNILIVWFLTGFWHGAGWNFIAWGMFFGVLLLVEKFFLGKILERLPRAVSHIYVLVIVCVSWALFDAPTMADALRHIGLMFGSGATELAGAEALYYLRSYLVPLILAVIGATPLPRLLLERLETKRANRVFDILEPVAVALLLIAVTAYLVDGSFNPFIYFRF
jgi:alginate O-acetyltransferase complex protein AlgI